MKTIPGILLIFFLSSLVVAENWPQWRGPSQQGVTSELGLVTQWGDRENILWKTSIPGRGHSSPIVWNDQLFLTTALEGPELPDGPRAPKHMMGDQEFKHPDWTGSDHVWSLKVLSLDRKTGQILWERAAYEGPVYDHKHRANTYASPTPVTDGTYLWAYFGAEGIYCYDLQGNLIWEKDLGDIGTIGMGVGSSPVLHEDKIILVCDQNFGGNESFVVALNKRTGERIWKVDRTQRASWATPLLLTVEGRDELLVSGAEQIVSYDPATGEVIWTSEGVVSHAIPSIVYDDKRVYLSAGSQAKRAMAIRLGGRGDLTGSDYVVWRHDKGTAYVPSPIYYQGYLYLMTDKGILTCLDAETGEVIYEGGRVPVPATFKASPVAFDGKILLSSEDGDVFVIKAGPQHEVLQTNSLHEPIVASPAISNGVIFIRGAQHLFAIGRN